MCRHASCGRHRAGSARTEARPPACATPTRRACRLVAGVIAAAAGPGRRRRPCTAPCADVRHARTAPRNGRGRVPPCRAGSTPRWSGAGRPRRPVPRARCRPARRRSGMPAYQAAGPWRHGSNECMISHRKFFAMSNGGAGRIYRRGSTRRSMRGSRQPDAARGIRRRRPRRAAPRNEERSVAFAAHQMDDWLSLPWPFPGLWPANA